MSGSANHHNMFDQYIIILVIHCKYISNFQLIYLLAGTIPYMVYLEPYKEISAYFLSVIRFASYLSALQIHLVPGVNIQSNFWWPSPALYILLQDHDDERWFEARGGFTRFHTKWLSFEQFSINYYCISNWWFRSYMSSTYFTMSNYSSCNDWG